MQSGTVQEESNRPLFYSQEKKARETQPRQRPSLPEELPPVTQLFDGTCGPLEVEIGCGKGKFLLERAQANPQTLFLGVDYALKWLRLGAGRSDKRAVRNARFIRANAELIVEKYLPPESVSIFHIYFPDPWHKRRHQKRRLLAAGFLKLLHSRLKPGGLVEIATDQADYYEKIRKSVDEVRADWRTVKESVNQRIFSPEIKTSYELKYETEGRPLYYMELIK